MFQTMLSRFAINKTLPFVRLLSSISKNYICDSSVIEAYQTNEKLKSIIDRQEHQFYYQPDKQNKSQPPTVFKPISAGSQLPENPQYLTKYEFAPIPFRDFYSLIISVQHLIQKLRSKNLLK